MSRRLDEMDTAELTEGFRRVLNLTGMDTALDTPDYLLAEMLVNTLTVYSHTKEQTERWHGQDGVVLKRAGGDTVALYRTEHEPREYETTPITGDSL